MLLGLLKVLTWPAASHDGFRCVYLHTERFIAGSGQNVQPHVQFCSSELALFQRGNESSLTPSM